MIFKQQEHSALIAYLKDLGLGLLLVVLTGITFSPVAGFDFINYDDPYYVYGNKNVLGGLSVSGIRWAFSTFYFSNYHPLTWLSHMLDVSYFGLEAKMHHVTNLSLHIVNVLLVYAWFLQLIKRRWESFVIAALFALHPMHVQSVAWISERKDMLSTCFGIMAIMAYHRYLRHGGLRKYAWVLLFFTLSLLSKSMLVTLPLVLMIMDQSVFKPLIEKRGDQSLRMGWIKTEWLDKIPMLMLSLAIGVVTVYAQKVSGAVRNLDEMSVLMRFQNTVLGYLIYIKKMFWPVDLSIFYPFYSTQFEWQVTLLASGVIGLISWAAIRYRERLPYFFSGWFFYIITLLPVIGILLVGAQPYADRYSYVPYLGLFWAGVQGLNEAARRIRKPAYAVVLMILLLLPMPFLTRHALAYWKCSNTIFARSMELYPKVGMSYYHLGSAYFDQGQFEKAIEILTKVLDIYDQRNDWAAHYAKILILRAKARLEGLSNVESFYEALHYQDDPLAIQNPTLKAAALGSQERVIIAQILVHLGDAVGVFRQPEKMLMQYEAALHYDPRQVEAHNQLGIFYADQGRFDLAETHFQAALAIDPGNEAVQKNRAYLEQLQSQTDQPRNAV